MGILIIPLRDKRYQNIGMFAAWCVRCEDDFVTQVLLVLVGIGRGFLMKGEKENSVFLWLFLRLFFNGV